MTAPKRMTVTQLTDIVESQRCLYGDAPLRVRPEPVEPFYLQVDGHYILDAQRDSDMREDGITLGTLAASLKGLPGNAVVRCHDPVRPSTQIGIYCPEEGRLVETLNASEFKPQRSGSKRKSRA